MNEIEELAKKYIDLQNSIIELIKAYKKDKNDIFKEIGALVSAQKKFSIEFAKWIQENEDNQNK